PRASAGYMARTPRAGGSGRSPSWRSRAPRCHTTARHPRLSVRHATSPFSSRTAIAVIEEILSGHVRVWVRPDLNRSRQHPKLVGFPVGRMTRGPRAQTKLPHGPAGRLE